MSSYNDDEFGNDDFLAEFDMDSAIDAYQQKSSEPSPNKRAKLMDSSASTTLTPSIHNTISMSPPQEEKDTSSSFKEELQTCLQEYFGHGEFRTGQYEAIRSVIQQKQDVAVFWSTGSGKSLCYQLPALYLNQITVVISPLISLMKDQVHKLNFLTGRNHIATFLGSGQANSHQEETKCLKGEYNIIYLTPEKLVSSQSFLEQLIETVGHRICLFAIDESHCVSEWGHDFRPQYSQIGNVLRPPTITHQYQQVASQIPIMAFTATATNRVQTDIMESLRLRTSSMRISKQSFDRTNLKIVVQTPRKDLPTIFNDAYLKQTFLSLNRHKQSTIIYTPTIKQTEALQQFLQHRLDTLAASSARNTTNATSTPQVQAYHAKLSQGQRDEAHMNFLTGKTTVIVATVAFGMGIDKPDTRRIIHYGPPKSVEEYYQQIGRAGRDGLAAECILHASPSDFDNYQSEFYLPSNIPALRKESFLQNLKAIKSYAMRSTTCRRKMLLDFFQETPTFGDHCGTCDVCQRRLQSNKENIQWERDFPEARIVLLAIRSTREQGLSTLLPIMGGNTKESYRYQSQVSPEQVKEQIAQLKQNITEAKKKNKQKPFRMTSDFFRDLVPPLVETCHIRESTKSAEVNGYRRSWTFYQITHKGSEALKFPTLPIILPVPESIREMERLEQQKREATIQKLTQEYGISKEKLPQEELENGDGDVIRAYTKWYGYLNKFKPKDPVEENDTAQKEVSEAEAKKKEKRLAHLEALLSSIEQWRSETAVQYSMAPGAVLSDHLVSSIAYTVATMKPGMKLESSALEAVGVRTRGVDSLCRALSEWVDTAQPAVESEGETGGEAKMVFPTSLGDDSAQAWEHAVYKPNKKTGLMAWEASYMRFAKGESPQSIAMTGGMGGKPIQVQTVCKYILEGLVFGKRDMDLNRLADFAPPPNKAQWEELENAASKSGLDVCADPVTSGRDGDKFKLTDFLRPIMGDEFADMPFSDRTEEDKATFGVWCEHLHWYMALKRSDIEPTFG